MPAGVIRKELATQGFTLLLDGQTQRLRLGVLRLVAGQCHRFQTEENEYGLLLIQGCVNICTQDGSTHALGPRRDPFTEKPEGALITCHEEIFVEAVEDSFLGVGIAAARQVYPNGFVHAADTGGGVRGKGNWERQVRFCLWNDNCPGNQLMMGETVIPAGNWSTFPPHRHQFAVDGEETAYDEAFFYLFEDLRGFGLIWQYNDENTMNHVLRFENGNVAYMDEGYHSIVCAPRIS